MIELEDFSHLAELKQKIEENREREEEGSSREDIEKFYREELLKLQMKYKKELERVREEAYRKGYQDALEKARSEYQKRLQESVKEVEKRYADELEGLRIKFEELLRNMKQENSRAVENFLKVVTDSLIEILNFLYISPENAHFVKENLEKLLGTFSDEKLISVEVGEKLGSILNGENVKIDNKLGENDFRLVFKDFTIESKIKDKLQILREEIEREAKKAAQI